jgi:hypothetical protein
MKAHKVAFEVPVKVWVGLPFLAVIGSRIFWLGASRANCSKHWWEVVLLIVVGELLLFMLEPAWRFVAALWEVCHEERFKGISRDCVRFAIIMGLLVALWGAGFWYDDYRHSPHLTLSLNYFVSVNGGVPLQGKYGISNTREKPQPNTEITFFSVQVDNTGIPSPATNWKAIVTPLDGNPVIGIAQVHDSEITDPQNPSRAIFTYRMGETIFYKTQSPIQHPVSGVASFSIVGMADDVARQPGTELTLQCEDKKGKVYSLTEIVPAIGISSPSER